MEDLQREKARKQTQTIFQTVLNLMGKSADPCVLTGEGMNQDEMIESATAENDKVVLAMIQAFRTQLLATFGRHNEGADLAISVGNRLANMIPCSTMVAVDPFFRALSLYGMARKHTAKSKRYRRHAKNARKIIKSYVKKGNPNVRHLESFLDAENAALNPRNYQLALKHFETATVMASRGGFLNDAALANEHFGDFLLKQMGDKEMAAFRHSTVLRLGFRFKGVHVGARIRGFTV
jgi:hypothetical protein